MLNPFPTLLAFSTLGPFILRILLGYFFFIFGTAKLGRKQEEKTHFFEAVDLKPGKNYAIGFGILETAVSLALLAGLYTQIAALIAIVILLATVIIERRQPELLASSLEFYIALLVIACSLLLTGAGAFAFDIPL
jgi:uncharacterized membrane protein YphA (DoxX/SURF4 family)